jgi:hypothetical protein
MALIECADKCGQLIEEFDEYGRPRRFVKGHNTSLRVGTANPNYGKRGVETSKYKTGRTKSGDGRYWVLSGKYGYHGADKHGRIYEHIFIFQEYYKCCMLPWGQVHHINKDGLDNRIFNLKGVSASEHTKIHNPKKDRENTFCVVCGGKTTIDKRGYPRWHKYQDGYRCDVCYKRDMRSNK